MISVIVPAYNEEKYIAETLESLSKQTSKDYEIIVVNNNSVDKTAAIARKYTKKVYLEKKKGYHNAVNLGVKKAKGEYITFCDADSLYPENWVESIQKGFDRDTVAVYGGVAIREQGFFLHAFGIPLVNLFMGFSRLIGFDFVSGFNLAFRKKSYLEIGGYDMRIYSGANPDLEIAKRISSLGKVKFLPKVRVRTSTRRGKDMGLVKWMLSLLKTGYSIYRKKPVKISYEEYNKEIR